MRRSPPKRRVVLAIDTNVVVRLLTGDDPDQAERSRRLLAGAEVLVASTVMMEVEWVLRSAYGFAKQEVNGALRAFAGLPMVSMQDPERIAAALELSDAGLDFADALHLAASDGCDALVTFDRRFAKAAAGTSAIEVRLL